MQTLSSRWSTLFGLFANSMTSTRAYRPRRFVAATHTVDLPSRVNDLRHVQTPAVDNAKLIAQVDGLSAAEAADLVAWLIAQGHTAPATFATPDGYVSVRWTRCTT